MKDQKKAGVILSYAGQLVHILSGIIYTPIMLRLLGQNEYGLYHLVYSVVSYLGLLNLGFNAAYMRFYARAKVSDDKNGVAKLNGMFLLIFGVISAVCVLCGIVMLTNIHGLFGEGLSEQEYATAEILMIMMVINLALSFPGSVFNCIITSQERFVFQKTVQLLQYIASPFLTLPLLLLGYGSIGMVSVTTFLTVFVLAVNIYYCFIKLRTKVCFKELKFSLLREMWVFTFFIFLNQIIDQVNWSVDKFLLGRILGTAAVAVYGIGGQINTLYLQFSVSVSNVFVPKVNKIVAETDDNKEITRLFTKVGRIQFIIMMLILTGFIFLGQDFIKVWAGEGYDESYYVALCLLIPVTVPLIQNLGIEIQRAKNKHKARSVVYFCIAVVNVFISIPLIQFFGPVGAAFGTTIALTAGNILFINWYYHKKIGIDILYFWKNIVSFIPGLIIPCIAGVVYMLIPHPGNIAVLVVSVIVYSAVYCLSMFFLGMNKEEKSLITGPLKRKIKR